MQQGSTDTKTGKTAETNVSAFDAARDVLMNRVRTCDNIETATITCLRGLAALIGEAGIDSVKLSNLRIWMDVNAPLICHTVLANTPYAGSTVTPDAS